MSLNSTWSSLDPKKKKLVIIAGIVIGLGGVILYTYKSKQSKASQKYVSEKPKEVGVDPDFLKRAGFEENRRKAAKTESSIEDLRLKIEKLESRERAQSTPKTSGDLDVDRVQGRKARALTGSVVPPPPLPPDLAPSAESRAAAIPGPASLYGAPTSAPQSVPWPAPTSGSPSSTPPPQVTVSSPPTQRTPLQQPPERYETFGGIANFPNASDSKSKAPAANSKSPTVQPPAQAEAKKKESPTKIHLSPGIMPAKLLTGLDASTSGGSSGNPEPMLLRVQAPAILPNSIRANLRGCFIIAEGTGRLDKERIDVRLLSINCYDSSGHGVIDEKIKGFVTDADGKLGLSGHVYSKMGAAMARAMIGGVVKGGGDAIKDSASSQSVSPLGVTQIVDPAQMGRVALGGGISEGIKPLIDIYTDLAKQSTPVIEKLPGADVTAIISEGVDLSITIYENNIAGDAR